MKTFNSAGTGMQLYAIKLNLFYVFMINRTFNALTLVTRRRITFDIFILSEIISQTRKLFALKFGSVYISPLAYEYSSHKILKTWKVGAGKR